MPKLQPLPSIEEPRTSLDELVRQYGAATVMRELGRVLQSRSRELRDEPVPTRRAVRRAVAACGQVAVDFDEHEVCV